MTKYTVKVPKSAIAGLVGEMADQLTEIQDTTVRVSPDGILRQFNIGADEVKIIGTVKVNDPITALTFSYKYRGLALGSPLGMGAVHVMEVGNPDSLKPLFNCHHGEFIAVGVLAAVVEGEVRDISTVTTKSNTVKVAVATHTGKHAKETSDQLSRFEITDSLIKDLKYSYNSLKCDLKDDAINKMTLFFMNCSLGIALGEGAVAYTIAHGSRKVHILNLPDTKPAKERKLSIYPHDYKSGGVRFMAFSDDCQSIFTTGFDGTLCCFQWK
nr:hypothetical protein BaRGS_007174 [Batillaria attramentaria]